MTTALLIAALVLTVTATLVVVDRRDARACAEREADRAERQMLLQRIQAPEQAVIQHVQQAAVDDDPAPLADTELLDEDTQEAILRMEEMERREAPWLVS